ncbi:MAG TPA: acyl-CoA dehydrogenase family protein [Candidatus Limnocylindrales bacterium]|nr:acyl-CoA dehydrogenase family protein [Candidatus Limnocylindrales bacterium]
MAPSPRPPSSPSSAAIPDPRPVRAFLEGAHVDLAARAAAFAARELAPRRGAETDDEARTEALSLVAILGEGKWLEPIRRQDWRAACLTREALGAASPLADAVFALQGLGTLPVLWAGSDSLRARWADAAIAGRAMAAFAMTEPEAGSDVAGMATLARREGEVYVLNGVKSYISNAGIADFYVVFASTDPDAGGKGISCFLVPADTPGLNFSKAQILSAPHPLGEITFTDCRVPALNRLGEEGRGFALGLKTLDRMRATVGAAASGMAARALDEAIRHARTRRQFGKALAEFQLVQEKVARMATELTAARLLVYRAAWEADHGADRVTLEAAMAKSYATEAAQRIIDDAIQVLGARGVMADHPVDRLYRAVRALRIYEGTTEIQHLVIAGQLFQPAPGAGG